MEVAIVKYNAGNVYSVESALRRLGVEPVLTDDAEKLRSAGCVLFPGQGEASSAKRFEAYDASDKIPAMGWNELTDLSTPLFKGIPEGSFVYFVHSYYVPSCPYTIATSDYIQPFSAAIHKDNYYATQFHPEKSGKVGEHILRNFLDLAFSYNPPQQ